MLVLSLCWHDQLYHIMSLREEVSGVVNVGVVTKAVDLAISSHTGNADCSNVFTRTFTNEKLHFTNCKY